MKNTILLIDGSSFIFRAFYAVKNLTSPNGMPTNAIYGVINMLKQMQKKYTTPYWVCVFDAKGKTFRDDIYPDYKANRRETPEELKQQIPYIHQIIADLGIPVIVEDGVEADDVIATIAKRYAAQDNHIIIATGDKDFAQVVNENITLVNTMNNESLDIEGVKAKFGVRPDQIIDYLSLIGDTVDNVPGVHKCGPKTAQKWLQEYDTLTNIIENNHKFTGAVGENLRHALEWLPTAKRLITIDCNVNVTRLDITNLNNLMLQTPKHNELVEIFRELNFRTWLKESLAIQDQQRLIAKDSTISTDLFSDYQDTIEISKNVSVGDLQYLSDFTSINQLINTIINDKQLSAVQLINNDYLDRNSTIIMAIIETDAKRYAIKFDAHIGSNELELNFDINQAQTNTQLITLLSKYFNSDNPKIVANSRLMYYQLTQLGIYPRNISGDITIADYIFSSNRNHELTRIIANTNQCNLKSPEELFGKGFKRRTFIELNPEEAQEYLQTISQILTTHTQIVAKLTAMEKNLYLDVELPLAKLLYEMELAGIKIDITRLKELSTVIHHEMQEIEQQVHQMANIPFNLNSPKQLQDILFNHLKLPTVGIKKLASGYSTDEENLSILAEQGYPIADLLLKYRYLNKLLNTYIDRLPEYADINGLVHTSLEQTIVTSGRLSSKDPNLQNIPVRSTYGQIIRECFIATDEQHVLVCADYSQIELRILAHISQDANLIAAFNSGKDIHLATASQIFAKPLEEVSKEERRYAKSINFGLIYGKSVFGLAKELKIERAAAKLYIDNYFAQYPKVRQYMDNIKQYAHDHGYVETIYGRKIHLANINASNNILRQAEERLALNAPMQGSAADIIKIAMLNIQEWLEQNQLRTKMILQVHDELIFNVPHDEVEILINNLPRLMSEKTQLLVNLDVAVASAANWGLAH